MNFVEVSKVVKGRDVARYWVPRGGGGARGIYISFANKVISSIVRYIFIYQV